LPDVEYGAESENEEGLIMLLAAFYVFAILSIIFYYTGHLKRWNCEWVLLVLAVAVFPAVLYL
jgi:Ca2+/Na+ antiporter